MPFDFEALAVIAITKGQISNRVTVSVEDARGGRSTKSFKSMDVAMDTQRKLAKGFVYTHGATSTRWRGYQGVVMKGRQAMCLLYLDPLPRPKQAEKWDNRRAAMA